MPQINLLAPGQKKTEKEKKPIIDKQLAGEFSQVITAVIVRSSICAAVCFAIWIFFAVNLSNSEKSSRELEGKVGALATNPKEIAKIQKERAFLEKKVQLIDTLSSRDFFWYKKLEVLPDLIPDGIWLTSVYVQQKSTGRSRRQPEKMGTGTTLVISGTSVSYKIQDAVTLIKNFIANLQDSADFAEDFSDIKLDNIAKSSVGGLDVMKFDLLCNTE